MALFELRFRPLRLISITAQLWSEYDKQTWGVKEKHTETVIL
jgi:hypothetical protein